MDYQADGPIYRGYPRPTAASRKCYSSTTHPGSDWLSIVERDLLALPVRFGGLGLSNPATSSPDIFQASQSLTAPHQEEHQEVKPSEESSTSQQHQWPTFPTAKTLS